MLKRSIMLVFASMLTLLAPHAIAAHYKIDTEGQHASITFRIQHLGYSWLYGRFNHFSGNFTLDEQDPAKNAIHVVIKTSSVDTNHAERDKHLRSADFLSTDKYPEAIYRSNKIEKQGDTYRVQGELTLHGVTKPITLNAHWVGEGADPWGGKRIGFLATTSIKLADFNIKTDLGPKSQTVELTLAIEGIKQ